MTTLPDGAVIITPNEVYREMQEISRKVDQLSTIIDPALAQLRDEQVQTRTSVAAIDGRVRALENWRWFVLGVATVFGPLGGLVLSRLFGGGA